MSRGKTLELMKPDPNTGKVRSICFVFSLSRYIYKENTEALEAEAK